MATSAASPSVDFTANALSNSFVNMQYVMQ
jgi:hypothetical protein